MEVSSLESTEKIILKKDSHIRIRTSSNEEWDGALVISRAGKATGKDKNAFNLLMDGEETPVVMDLDRCQVQNLLPEEQVILYEEEGASTVFNVNPSEDEKLQKAKLEELKKFKSYGVYSEVQDAGQSTVSCRWVITKKGETVKARLVARGFEEIMQHQVDAPTVAPGSLWIFFTLCASFNWKIESLDITAAFLQSENIDRTVYIRPPKDIKKKGVVWKLTKPMYGLGDSARLWYLTLKQHLLSLGCKMSKLDQTVFRFYENGKLSGVLVTHVDDLLYAGDTKFHQTVIKSIMNRFKISRQYSGCFTYLGLNVVQNRELGMITVDQIDYAKTIKEVPIAASRNKNKDNPLTHEELASYQKVLGKLLWLSGRTRPDLSYDTMELSTYAKSPMIKHLNTLNLKLET